MSYILDALRRADAERERERSAVPGLNSQPVAALSADTLAAQRRAPVVWLALVLGLVIVVGSGAWFLGGRQAAEGDAAPLARNLPPAAAAPPPAVPERPSAPPPAAAPAPTLRLAQTPPTEPLPRRAEPARPVPRPAASAARPSPAAPVTAAEPPPAPAPITAAPPHPPAADAATRVNSIAELPATVRQALPGLSFGGSVYSPAPANRLLIVGGQVMHEGDALGGNVTLEQIKPHSAVLNAGGQRYEVGF